MSVGAQAWLSLLGSLGRVFGGGGLLFLLGAPGWALAAWFLMNVRVRIGHR
jgi:hypothetical protein